MIFESYIMVSERAAPNKRLFVSAKTSTMIGKIIIISCISFVFGRAFKINRPNNPFGKLRGVSRIIGGREATPHAYPFVANLYVEFGSDGFGCGGSLLNSEWVLTAAHCAYHRDTEEYWSGITVTLGEHDENKDEGTEKEATVSHVIIHDNYIKNGKDDLALLKLASPLLMTDSIDTACLTSKGKDYVGKTAKAVGWGRISSHKPGTSPVLKEANIPIVSDDTCEKVASFNSENMLCSGFEKEPGKDTVYSGDSGGPLFLQDGSGKATIIGLSSFVTVDPKKNIVTHAIFVELSAYVDWIEEQIPPSKLCTN